MLYKYNFIYISVEITNKMLYKIFLSAVVLILCKLYLNVRNLVAREKKINSPKHKNL